MGLRLAVATAATGLLAACATGPAEPAASGSASPPASAPASQPPSDAPPSSPGLPTTSPTPGAELTLTGTVEAGVERGCMLLAAEGKKYLLSGGDPKVVKVGAKITVRGYADPGRPSFCMQGIPFTVTEAHPA